MTKTRRSLLGATGTVALAAVAGCLGGTEIEVPEAPTGTYEDGTGRFTFMVETDDPPVDVEVEITTHDENDEELAEITDEATIEAESDTIVVEEELSENFAGYEWTISEV